MRHAILFIVSIAAVLATGCDHSSPTDPIQGQAPGQPAASLTMGRWSAEAEGTACLTVEQAQASLIAGCWRGRFARPSIGADGTFSAEGTFRFEAGPSTDTPAPAAQFTGAISGTTLTLTVQQKGSPNPPVTFSLTFSGEGTCSPLCV